MGLINFYFCYFLPTVFMIVITIGLVMAVFMLIQFFKKWRDDRIKKQIISFLKEFECDHYRCLDFSSWIAWLERQGEQKPVDKVEPKFHEGDWVVTDKGDTVQIGTVNNGYYTIGNGMLFSMPYVDTCWHLWTIADAKDGDVLCIYKCDEPKIVFIFKGILKKHCALSYHCYYNIMYPYFSGSEKGCLVSNNEDVKPATKEQRDQLKKAMLKDGYKWNADKKELIKL